VSLWRDPDDVTHCRILSSDKALNGSLSRLHSADVLCTLYPGWLIMVHDTHMRKKERTQGINEHSTDLWRFPWSWYNVSKC